MFFRQLPRIESSLRHFRVWNRLSSSYYRGNNKKQLLKNLPSYIVAFASSLSLVLSYKWAMKIYQATQTVPGQKRAKMNISGRLGRQLDSALSSLLCYDPQDAIPLLTDLLERDLPAETEALVRQQLGFAHFLSGNFPLSQKELEMSLRLFKKIGLSEHDFEVLYSTLYSSLVCIKQGSYDLGKQGLIFCANHFHATRATWETAENVEVYGVLALKVYSHFIRSMLDNDDKTTVESRFFKIVLEDALLLSSQLLKLNNPANQFGNTLQSSVVTYHRVMIFNDDLYMKLIKSKSPPDESTLSSLMNSQTMANHHVSFERIKLSQEMVYHKFNEAWFESLRGNPVAAYEKLYKLSKVVTDPVLTKRIGVRMTQLWDQYAKKADTKQNTT